MKAFTINPKAKIHFYSEPIRMQAMMDKLTEIVTKEHKQKPTSGDVFLFINKKQNYVKALFYSNSGYYILAKRLDPFCRFEPVAGGIITAKQMTTMLDHVLVPGRKKLKRAA